VATDDDRYRGVLETLGELAQEIREHKTEVQQSWQMHRQTVNSAIGILSSELVRMQHIFDQFAGEIKAKGEQDDAGRLLERAKSARFRWATLAAIGVLIVVNLLVLAYFIGRAQ
jgi:hypothetical protein